MFLFPVMDISHFFNWFRGKGLLLILTSHATHLHSWTTNNWYCSLEVEVIMTTVLPLICSSFSTVDHHQENIQPSMVACTLIPFEQSFDSLSQSLANLLEGTHQSVTIFNLKHQWCTVQFKFIDDDLIKIMLT